MCGLNPYKYEIDLPASFFVLPLRNGSDMNITAEISFGELLDKITILEIKSERIPDETKLININKELKILSATWQEFNQPNKDIDKLRLELKSVNEQLWEIEDDIRIKESKGLFDNEFIELARSVYIVNDKRSVLKKQINELLGSNLIEEKSYADYTRS